MDVSSLQFLSLSIKQALHPSASPLLLTILAYTAYKPRQFLVIGASTNLMANSIVNSVKGGFLTQGSARQFKGFNRCSQHSVVGSRLCTGTHTTASKCGPNEAIVLVFVQSMGSFKICIPGLDEVWIARLEFHSINENLKPHIVATFATVQV